MRINGDYTKLVEDPEKFIRFDLTEGMPWFKKELLQWVKNIPLETLIHYPSADKKNHKSLLAQWLHVQNSNIFLGNGSDELIDIIAQTFLRPLDKVLVLSPSFFRFSQASKKVGAGIETVLFSEQNGFEWNNKITKRFLHVAQKREIKIIWLANPNNPTGVDIPAFVFKRIIELNKLVIIDKALNGFTKELREAAQHIWNHKKLIVLSSFSKTFGLAGLRFGFGITSSRLVKKIEEKQLPFTISGPTLWIIEKLLKGLIGKKIHVEDTSEIIKEKHWVTKELRKIHSISIIGNSKANFLLLKSLQGINLFEKLKEKKILVTDMNSTSGLDGEMIIRATIRTNHENKKLLQTLKEIDREGSN